MGEKCIKCFGGETLRERGHLGDPGIIRGIASRCIYRKWDGGLEWIDLADDGDKSRAVVNAVMNIRVP